ncbi:hypothetical protein ACQRET_03605 [Streptomyces koyangensis]|uniref:hypothetical protein n=1 Tax=Streptomyces koyangensis TaxID=188770 RepID=UPI003D034E36
MTEPFTDEVRTIGEALAAGVAGDLDRGAMMLQPLVDRGRRETFAVLGSLAEAATFIARRDSTAGAFGLHVADITTGESASADELPPPVRFAFQYVTACANRDPDAALGLFTVFADHCERTGAPDLGEAIGLVYGMAVTTSTQLIREAREAREAGEDRP